MPAANARCFSSSCCLAAYEYHSRYQLEFWTDLTRIESNRIESNRIARSIRHTSIARRTPSRVEIMRASTAAPIALFFLRLERSVFSKLSRVYCRILVLRLYSIRNVYANIHVRIRNTHTRTQTLSVNLEVLWLLLSVRLFPLIWRFALIKANQLVSTCFCYMRHAATNKDD